MKEVRKYSIGQGFTIFVVLSLTVFQIQAANNYKLFGFAGTVTGGGSATPYEAKTFADLKTAVESSGAKVIHVMNSMGNGAKSGDVLKVKSDKTIIGAKPGIVLKTSFQIESVKNIIVRNIIVEGPGSDNSQEFDNVLIQGSSSNI